MRQLATTLRLLFVKPFYAENASFFVLVFTMMFVIVGSTHGYGLYAYHHSLAVGMLSNVTFLLGVFALWFLYARKYTAYVAQTMRQPQFAFTHIFSRLHKGKLFVLFALVQLWLLLPVIVYAIFVIAIGVQEHYYWSVISIVFYLLALCVAGAAWHVYSLNNQHKNLGWLGGKTKGFSTSAPAYTTILLRFIIKNQKGVLLGIKLFTCGIVYLIARNNYGAYYDITLPFLFFNFGVLANGMLIYRIKIFEATYLSFYKALPVALVKRQLQYSLIYSVLLLPECITLCALTPTHLKYADGLLFWLSAFATLLLLNTVGTIQVFSKKEFAAVLLLLFAVQYVFMLVAGLTALCLFFLVAAVLLFLYGYYKYDATRKE